MQVVQLKLKKSKTRKSKRIQVNCFRCLESSRMSPTIGLLPNHELQKQLYCNKWKVIVPSSIAKCCPFFTPAVKKLHKQRRKRKGEPKYSMRTRSICFYF